MSFLSDLFGSDDKPKNPADSAPKTPPGPEVYHAVIGLIAVSADLQAQLKADVQRAFDQPEAFYEDGEYTLAQRGLTYPKAAPLTPKFVLIDTLIDHEQMAEVDWKEAEEDIRFAINGILAAKGFPFELSEDDQYEDLDTFSVIDSIDSEELQPAGYYLAILDINSDSYVFTIVPLEQQPEVDRLFAQLK